MPGGDRTGPVGMGPMTGRAAGYCAGYGVPGYMTPVGGGFRGWGRGRGGRGWRHQFYATGLPGWASGGFGAAPSPAPSAESELEALKQQAEFMHDSLEQINRRIQEIQSK